MINIIIGLLILFIIVIFYQLGLPVNEIILYGVIGLTSALLYNVIKNKNVIKKDKNIIGGNEDKINNMTIIAGDVYADINPEEFKKTIKDRYPLMHITGTPGSGKTWAGNYMSKKYPNLLVVDIDLIVKKEKIYQEVDNYFKKYKWSIESINSAGKLYTNMLDDAIWKIITENIYKKPILLVGIAYIMFEHDEKLYWSMPGFIHYVDNPYFIKISNAKLSEQRFHREIEPICSDKKFRKSIINGQYLLYFNSNKIIDDHKIVQGFYLENSKYKLMDQKDVINSVEKIMKLIKVNNKLK